MDKVIKVHKVLKGILVPKVLREDKGTKVHKV